jgi:hypothetical protein
MTFGPTLYFPYVNSDRFKGFILLAAQLLLRVACPGRQTQAGAALDPVVAKRIAGKPGVVVVLDVSSGKILARSSLRVAAQRGTTPGSVVKPFVLTGAIGVVGDHKVGPVSLADQQPHDRING